MGEPGGLPSMGSQSRTQLKQLSLASWITALSWQRGLCNSAKLSHTMQGHTRWTCHSGEFWQNVVHWRRKWKTTPIFLPQKPHGQYDLEGLMLKLKLQYFGHLMRRTDSLEKTLVLGKIEGKNREGPQRMGSLVALTQWMWNWKSSGNSRGQRGVACCSPCGHKSQMWLSDWTNSCAEALIPRTSKCDRT